MRRITFAVLFSIALFAPAIDAQQAPATRIADRTGGGAGEAVDLAAEREEVTGQRLVTGGRGAELRRVDFDPRHGVQISRQAAACSAQSRYSRQ